MAESDDVAEWIPDEGPLLHCPHLLICRAIWFDPSDPERGFSLGGIRTAIAPTDGGDCPFQIQKLYACAQLWGTPGEYHLRIRIHRIEVSGYDEEVEVELGPDGSHLEYRIPGHRPYELTGLNFVEEFALAIGPLTFPEYGVYEFQLWADEIDAPVARERVIVREG